VTSPVGLRTTVFEASSRHRLVLEPQVTIFGREVGGLPGCRGSGLISCRFYFTKGPLFTK